MRRAEPKNKDLLNPAEAIDCFRLSRRKFYALLKKNKDNDFIVFYGSRKLIIRTAFEKYLLEHQELRRRC